MPQEAKPTLGEPESFITCTERGLFVTPEEILLDKEVFAPDCLNPTER